MTLFSIDEADLHQLETWCPELDFADEERRAVLLELASRDVQAAPGSGKTTLLAAKLLLLSQKWTHPHQGICVLSHTNVARDEIVNRLSQSVLGARLLSYPHFFGTIHAFVNHFLALPYLRSNDIAIESVDNDLFAIKASSLLQGDRSFSTLKAWVNRNPNQGQGAVATLHYKGSLLELGWESGNSLPSPGTASYQQAEKLKARLTLRGIFRHDDMFAFAAKLLAIHPRITNRISSRFPLVLIDEMQDTSWGQEELLSSVFNDEVVVQRYGDRNQRIMTSLEGGDNLTFPNSQCLYVTTTKRFPDHIAAAVRAVQEHGEAVTAAPSEVIYGPVLLLYETSQATKVIERFGEIVLELLPDHILNSGPVKAVCTRKTGDGDKAAGRHLGDYWPPYLASGAKKNSQDNLYNILLSHPRGAPMSVNLEERARKVKRVMFLALRQCACEITRDLRDASGLMKCLSMAGVDVKPVREVCRNLVVGVVPVMDDAAWEAAVDSIYNVFVLLLPVGLTREEFRAFKVFERAPLENDVDCSYNRCVVSVGGRVLSVDIGTVASVKGETHAATLVLESYGGQSRRFDLEEALLNLGGVPIKKNMSKLLRGQYRNLYVAMSRPRHLLCLAMNKERSTAESVEKLSNSGWTVMEV